MVQHCACTTKSIIPADNKPHIVVFLGKNLPSENIEKQAERKSSAGADCNLWIDAGLKDVDEGEHKEE